MKILVKKDTTSKLIQFFVYDSSKTDGSGLTGLVYNTSGLTAYYYREGAASATGIVLATMTLGTWATGGFVVVDGTNMPGWYQLGIPNAALASGASSVGIQLKGAANMAPVNIEIQLVNFDPEDGVRLGLTALPNAAAEAAGGLYTRGTGAGQIAQDANGNIRANVDTIKTQSVTCAAGVTVNAYVGETAQNTAQTGDAYARIGAAGAGLTSLGDTRLVNLDATVSSRQASGSAVTLPASATITITGNLVGDVTGKVLGGGAGQFAGTGVHAHLIDNDFAGIAAAVWCDTVSGDFTVDQSIGKALYRPAAPGNANGFPTIDGSGHLLVYSVSQGVTLAASQHVIVDSGTVTTLTNLPSIPSNWLTAAGIASGALNGKGDWPSANANADAFALRDWAEIDDDGAPAYCFLNMGREIRNKFVISGTSKTTYKEDGTTPAFVRTVTIDAAALPITGAT